MSGGLGYLAAGYAIFVFVLVGYLVSLARRQTKIERRLNEMADRHQPPRV